MTYYKEEIKLGDFYTVDEDDNLRLGQYIDVGTIVVFFVLYIVVQTVLVVYFVDMFTNRVDIIKAVCCGVLILFFTVCLIMTLYYFLTYKNYSLVVSSKGIKNKTNKGIVMLPWNEFNCMGIVDNVTIVGHRGYHNFIYISNCDISEKKLRKTIKNSQSQFYINADNDLVIAIAIQDAEKEALYLKIQDYISKFKTSKTH